MHTPTENSDDDMHNKRECDGNINLHLKSIDKHKYLQFSENNI